MPIYEYRCNKCHRQMAIFTHSFSQPQNLTCEYCGSNELTRLFSTFTMGKGEWYKRKGVYEDVLGDSQLTRAMMRNDPQALAEWNKRMTKAMEDPPGPEFDEMTARLEAGEPADEVAKKTKEEVMPSEKE